MSATVGGYIFVPCIARRLFGYRHMGVKPMDLGDTRASTSDGCLAAEVQVVHMLLADGHRRATSG